MESKAREAAEAVEAGEAATLLASSAPVVQALKATSECG